jgi:hypothetical protein
MRRSYISTAYQQENGYSASDLEDKCQLKFFHLKVFLFEDQDYSRFTG